jgi:cytochrome b561
MKPASRYHPLLVALHWLLAALILAALAVGFFGLAAMPNADPKRSPSCAGTWPAAC